ncbi:hypothetical protein [Dyadobacter crusticola]|uniref:hypothetical protein n=1 Tax=Dyadobacter crusticola TaxID=292407 RepID=UPI0004E16F25|nr:hypothetical protein [Dyadobacter crusticola]
MKPSTAEQIAAICFGCLIVLFIGLAIYSEPFFNWAYARHQNQLSWYIRPLFLIPYCYFSFRRSLAGVLGTVFLLLTSMFWFPSPEKVPENVRLFLEFEKEWLRGTWTFQKALLAALAPVSMLLLSIACWQRSLVSGMAVLVLIACGKILWAVSESGAAGGSIIIPAITGLLLCCLLVYLALRSSGGINLKH